MTDLVVLLLTYENVDDDNEDDDDDDADDDNEDDDNNDGDDETDAIELLILVVLHEGSAIQITTTATICICP